MADWRNEAEKIDDAYDWRKDAEVIDLKPKPLPYTPVESAVMGGLQGITANHADEIESVGRAGLDVLGDKYELKDLWDRYKANRETVRPRYKKAEEDNPKSYGSANIAASLAPAALGPLGVAGAAGLSALSSAGASEAKPFEGEAKAYAADTALGGVLGAGTQYGFDKAAKYIGPVVSKAADWTKDKVASGLKNIAEDRAVKAVTGQNISALRKMGKTTLNSAGDVDAAQAGIRKVGRDILDEPGVLRVGSRAEGLAPKLAQARNQYGEKIGEVAKKIDEIAPGSINPQAISDDILNYAATIPEVGAGKNVQKRLLEEAENFANMKNVNFSDAQNFKNQFKFKPVDADALINSQDASNKVRQLISKRMEEAADDLAAKSPDTTKELLGQYKQLKSKYGSFKGASDAATDRVQKNLSNRFVAPSDYGLGSAAGVASAIATGGSVGTGAVVAALAGAANKVGRERGSAAVARTADNLSKMLQNNPQAMQQFGGIIKEAAERGPAALLSTQYILMQRPDFRKLFEEENNK